MTTSNLGGLQQQTQIKATAQQLTLQPGLYALTVVGSSTQSSAVDGVPIPSAQIAVTPGSAAFVERLSTVHDGWLIKLGDSLVVKVAEKAANLVLTSYKIDAVSTESLNIQILRLDGNTVPPQATATPQLRIKADVVVHVQNRGDLLFSSGTWAGSLGERLWVEGFGISLAEGLVSEDIEYKALLATGWETPWVPGGQFCGSRGTSVPMIGFAIRLTGGAASRFDCVYEGAFISGHRVGACQNGFGCCSTVSADPLEGIRLRIVEKAPSNSFLPKS